MERARRAALACAAALVAAAACAGTAAADPPLPELGSVAPLGAEVQHLHYKYGPISITPGGNLILAGPVTIEKPAYDGYMTMIKPNLVRADGSVPPVDEIHLHHSVWLDLTHKDISKPDLFPGKRFFAAGEEKTTLSFPSGYGYPVNASDVWAVNYMIHNQTPVPEEVWITYDVDFVPAASELGQTMKAAQPVWMDVDNGEAYPVFDSHRGSGTNGVYTYPPGGTNGQNEWTVPQDGALVWAGGHVHPGGLYTDLDVRRGTQSTRVFRSEAEYFDPNGPVSWDMAMTVTDPGWRVGVNQGDKLRLTTGYETQRASWYEGMGIDIVLMAFGESGPDPFTSTIDTTGEPTHGQLPEATHYGGEPTGLPDPRDLPDGQTFGNRVEIGAFTYFPGNLGTVGLLGNPPVIPPGGRLTFDNQDWESQIYHTITACAPPCNGSTGVSYPLADGTPQFDSGNLGFGAPFGYTAAANRVSYQTPANLDEGTYTYFCRIHPYMRGSFRVK